MKHARKYFTLLCCIYFVSLLGCKKLVTVNVPDTSITAEAVYSSDATATAVMTGIYASLAQSAPMSKKFMNWSIYGGLLADELTLWNGESDLEHIRLYLNDLTSAPGNYFPWDDIFVNIFKCNSAIEGFTNSTSLTPVVKNQLLGEAKFLRGFFYFYLVNFYGDVPLVLTADYKENQQLPRSSIPDVYNQIILDLNEAQELLSSDFMKGDARTSYVLGTEERIRPSKWAAIALLARVYLYTENWADAEVQASIITNYTTFFDTVSINDIFLKNSKEAIWQLQPVNSGWNTEDAKILIIPSTGLNNEYPIYLNDLLLNAFEQADKRKDLWTGLVTLGSANYHYAYKYKSAELNSPVTEYFMILRVAEQYLIRAEARAQLGNIDGAKSDLNIIRKRAGLDGFSGQEKSQLLDAIMQERRVELFLEFGHRWFDMKRTKIIDEHMKKVTALKGGTWESKDSFFPIPLYDLQRNPNLTQNSGY